MTGRAQALTSWYDDWRGLRVTVVGLTPHAFAAADTLAELGARVVVVAAETDDEYARLVEVIGAELRTVAEAELVAAVAETAPDLLIAPPSVPAGHPLETWTRAASVPLWGDVELAWRVRDKATRAGGIPAHWLLVAGSNGRARVAELAAVMLLSQGLRAAPCGGEGVPVLDAVRDPAGFDALVIELSDLQLRALAASASAAVVSPLASLCLDAVPTPDGPAWHGSAVEALRDRGIVYRSTVEACVYDKRDVGTRAMVEDADVVEGARAVGFDVGVPGPGDLGVVDGILVDRAFLAERRTSALELTTLDELADRGLAAPRAVSDILAAAALARAAGAAPAAISAALKTVGAAGDRS